MSIDTAAPRPSKLPSRLVIGWGLGSLGVATPFNTFNVLLLPYLAVVVGLSPALAGSLILITKLYDTVTDLPMGWLSDRTQTRFGRRRPYMAVATIVTPVAVFALFRAPATEPVGYIVLCLLLYATGYTLFNVPYLSMPAELTASTDTRTKMVAWRSVFIAVGTLFGVSIAPYLVGSLGGGADAYATLGSVMAIVVMLAYLGSTCLTSSPTQTRRLQPTSLRADLAGVFGNGHFLRLALIKATHLLGLAVGAGSLFFFFRYALGYDLRMLGIYGGVTMLAWMVAMPLWTRVAAGRGKRFGYFVVTLAYAALAASWLLADTGEALWLLLLRGAAFGVVSGGLLLMGNAMLQDIMDHDYRRSGVMRNGLYAGSYSLIEKISSGIGAQLLGIVLSTAGFDRALTNQSEQAVRGIYLCAALIPALLMLLSLVAIASYRLDESELADPDPMGPEE